MSDEPIIHFPTPRKRTKIGAIQELNPRGALVLVEKCDADFKTEGGVALPEDLQRDFQYARVLKMGPGRDNMSTNDLVEDDMVMYKAIQRRGPQTQDLGLPLTVDGVDCLLLNEHDILAVVPRFLEVLPSNGDKDNAVN